MSKKKLSILSVILAGLMLLTTACSGSGGNESTAEPVDPSEVGENWVSDHVVKLKFWAMKEDTVQDMNTNE